jgi:hypothetical protein
MTCAECRKWRKHAAPDCYGTTWGDCDSSKLGMTLEAEITGGIMAENDSCPFWEARR